ncbi:MAG: biotin--[acetyl-CoA-carboxylase] ligase [Desulfovibrio sp.]|nr:biotin--[acetyl-CoA-carboxylase] ligase [Desulfovibrio sp.]
MKSCEDTDTGSLPRIHELGEVDSVLDSAYTLAGEGNLSPWESVTAVSQRAGRGQMRRNWYSPEGNLYAALMLPPLPPFTCDCAAPAFGFLMAKAMNMLGMTVRLKWPNDLVTPLGEPRKLGGILLEERGSFIFAGIGINITSHPSDDAMRTDHVLPATSLHSAFSLHISAQKLWSSLVRSLIKAYKEEDNFATLWHEAIKDYLLWLGRPVTIASHAGPVEGILTGVAPDGALLLETSGGLVGCSSGSLAPLVSSTDVYGTGKGDAERI